MFFKTANGNPLKHKKPHKKTQQKPKPQNTPKRENTHKPQRGHTQTKTHKQITQNHKHTKKHTNTLTHKKAPKHTHTHLHTHKQQAPKGPLTHTTTHKPQTKPHTPPPNRIPRTPRARAPGRTCSPVTSGGAHHAPSGLGLVRLVGPLGPSASPTVCGRPPREPDAPARASVRCAQNPLSLTLLPPVPLPQSGVPPHRRRGECRCQWRW
jgi:hypothetical protein